MCGEGENIIFFFKLSLQFLIQLNNIFHAKDLKRFNFYVKLIDDKKNIESADLTQKVNLFLALTWPLAYRRYSIVCLGNL